MATITGQRASSLLPRRDTPRDAEAFSRRREDLPRAVDPAAEALEAWRAVTLRLAGTPHVRISHDGGRTYPARHARPLPASPPGQPCTVPVYDPGSATGRMLALDLDPARAARDVHDTAIGHCHQRGDDPAAEVGRQAEALAGLVTGLGGRVLADVSPSGGRHVLVLFAAALPWRELRDLARAVALRFPAVDVAPMSSLGGQISPPGSRHKSGGWRLLSVPLEAARAAVGRPNGPEVWNALLTEFAAELRQAEAAGPAESAELDDAGVPWVPRLGGRAPLGTDLERVARSEARMAVLGAAAARGWRLDEGCSQGKPNTRHQWG